LLLAAKSQIDTGHSEHTPTLFKHSFKHWTHCKPCWNRLNMTNVVKTCDKRAKSQRRDVTNFWRSISPQAERKICRLYVHKGTHIAVISLDMFPRIWHHNATQSLVCHITKNDAFKIRMFVVRAYEYSYIARESLYVSVVTRNHVIQLMNRRKMKETTAFLGLFFLYNPFCLSHCRCRGLLLHLMTMRLATLGKTPLPLDQCSARRRGLYQHSTQQTRETNIRVHRRIRILRRLTP
jgi:hypothetical protein